MDTTSSGLGPAARAEREAYLSGRTSDPEEQSNEGVSKSEIIAPTRVTHFRGPDGNLIKIKAPSGDGYLLKHSGQKHPVDPKTGDPVLISEDGTTSSIYDKAPTIKKDGVIYSAPPGYRQKAIGKDPDWNPNAPSTKEEQKAQATKAKEDAKNAKAVIDDNLARVTNIVSQIDADNQLKTIATKKDEAIAKEAEDEASKAVTESSAKLKALQSDKDSGAVDQLAVDAASADLEAKKQVAKKLSANASAISARGIEEDFKRATQKVVIGQNLEQVKLMTTSRRAALTMPSAAKTAPDAEKPAPKPSTPVSALPATGPVKQAEAVVKAPDIKNLSQSQSGFNSPFPHITGDKKEGGSVFDTPELPELNLPSYGEARHGNIKPAFFHVAKNTTNTHFIEDGTDAPADEWGFKEQGENKTTRRTPAQKAADDATPASWLTPEATAAREAAKATGTDLIHTDETLKVTLPELGKDDKKGGVWVDGQQVGNVVHNDLGLPEVILSQKAGGMTASPSYRSQNPFSGVPEYAEPSAQQIEQVKEAADKNPNGQDPAMVSSTIDKTWKSRRMEEDEFSALVENWKGAGEYERRKLMSAGVLKEMDKEMPDARLLYKQGVISLQQARTLDQAVYGRNPILPSPDASYEAWKAGDTDAAKRLREYEAAPAADVTDRMLVAARDELFTEWRNEYRNRHSDQPDFDPHAFNAAADKISGGQSTLAQRFWSGVSETGSNVSGSMLGMVTTVGAAGRTIGYILNQAAEDAGVFEEGTVKKEFLGDPLDKADIANAKSKMMAGEKLTKEDLIILWQDEFAMGRKAAPNVLQAVFTPETLKLTVETGIQQAKNLFSGLWMGRDSDPRKTNITGPVAPGMVAGGGFGGGGMRGFQTEAEKKAAVDKYMSERMLPGSPVGYTVDALIDAIEDENLTKGTIDQFAELLKSKAGSMHKITEGETESLAALKKLNPKLTDAEIKAHYDNQKSGKLSYYDIRNNQAPVAQLMVAYHETRDPAIAMLLREAFYQTPEGQENVAKAARYASVNGTIKNSDAYAVLDMSARGISVNPGEFMVEAAGDIVGYGLLKGLTSSQVVLRAAGKSAKLAKNVGRAANSANKIIDSVMKGMDELGTIAKQAGTVPGSTVRNAAVQTVKGLGVGTVTEGMEGVGSGLLNEARSTEKIWDDAVQEGMGGLFASFIGGSAAIVSSIFDAAKQKDAIRKGELGFVNFWNKQNPQTPIELDDVRGIMSFINPSERQQHDKDVMELGQKYFAEKDLGVPTPQTEAAFIEAIGRRNRAIQLAYEAHTELGGVGDQKMKDFIAASMKVLTGQPLTQRDQLAMEATDASGAPLAVKDGSEVTWTKEGLAQVAQATPGLRQTYFPRDVEQQEADRAAKKAQAEAQAKADAEAKAKQDSAPSPTPGAEATNPNGETGNSSGGKSEGDGSIPSSGSAPTVPSSGTIEEDQKTAAETVTSVEARTKGDFDARTKAHQKRAESAKRVLASLKPGDVVVDEEFGDMVVQSVGKDGKLVFVEGLDAPLDYTMFIAGRATDKSGKVIDIAPATIRRKKQNSTAGGPGSTPASGTTRTEADFANPDENYRIVTGDAAFEDIVNSGLVRTNADEKKGTGGTLQDKIGNRPTAFPSFAKGAAAMHYARQNPNHYIITTTDPSLQPSKSGRHSKGKTMFPTDAAGNHQTSLDAKNVDVWKHVGEGKYELVYSKGQVVTPQSKAKTEAAPAPTQSALAHPVFNGISDKAKARESNLNSRGVQTVTVTNDKEAADFIGAALKNKGRSALVTIKDGKPVVVFISDNIAKIKKTPESREALVNEELHHAAALLVMQENQELLNKAEREAEGINGESFYKGYSKLSARAKVIEAMAAYANGRWTPKARSSIRKIVDLIVSSIVRTGVSLADARPAAIVALKNLSESATEVLDTTVDGATTTTSPTQTPTNENVPTTQAGNPPGTGQTDSTTTDEQQPAPNAGSELGPESGPADEQVERPAPESKKAAPQWTIRTTRGRTLTIPADQAKDKQEASYALAQQTERGEMLMTQTLTQPDESGSDKTVVQQVYEVIANLIKGKHKDDAKFYASLGTMIAVALKKHMPTLEASFDKIVVLETEVDGGGMYVQGNTLYIAPRTFIKSLAALPAKDMQEFVDRGFFHEYLHTVIDTVMTPAEAGKFWRGLTEQAQDEFRAAYSQGKTDVIGSDSQWGNEYLRAYLENRHGKGISEEMFLNTKFFRSAVDLIKRIIARLTNIMESISDEADKEWMAEKISEINAAFVTSQQNITSGDVDAQRAAKVAKARAKPIGSSSLVKAHVNDNFGSMLKEIGVDLVPSFSSVSAHYVVSEGGKRRGGYIEYNPMTMAEWSPGQIIDAMREEMIHALEDKALIAEMMKQGHKMTDKYIQSGQYHIDFFDGIYGMMTPEQIKYVKSIYTSHGNRKYVIGSEFRRMVMQKEHYNGLTEQAMAGNKTPAKRNAALEAIASLFSAAVSTLKKMMFKNTQAGKQAKKVYDVAIADLRRIDPRGEANDLSSTIQPMAAPASGSPGVQDVRNQFLRTNTPIKSKLNEEISKEIADYHDSAPAGIDQATRDSYNAFNRETREQYEALVKAGYRIEPWEGKGAPYKDSAEMVDDVRNNKRLFYFKTSDGLGDNAAQEAEAYPPLEQSGIVINGKPIIYNDLFRAVHDIFGHGSNGRSFSTHGEFQAFQDHAAMYSKEAMPALALETLAYNAWFNAGKHLRREDGSLPAQGDKDFVPLSKRGYAPRKTYLFPQSLIDKAIGSRSEVTQSKDLRGDGRSFAKFFASVTQGAEDKFKPAGNYVPAIDLDPSSKAFQIARYRFRGNFDDHIATSIPGYDEVQAVVGSAIVKTFGDSGADMLDIGSSEGALNKAITGLSKGKIKTLAIDPNTSMAQTFKSKGSVEGAEFDLSAFGSKEDAGKTAWTEDDGTEVKFFDPKGRKFDVVHEAMVFQFISNARNAQVMRVKELMKPEGIAIFEQKFGDRKDVFDANESKKDLDWKSRHYTVEQLKQKRDAVLNSGGDQVEGMTALQVAHWEMEDVLRSNFKHVTQFWSSGNFRGYVASDSADTLSKFTSNLQSTDSEFATQATPRTVQPMAGPMSDPATLSDFDTAEGIKEIINKPGWAIFTAENPNKKRESDLRNAILNRGLMKDLDSDTMDYRQVDGHYGYPEKPFIVIDQGMSVQKAAALARKYGQESVLTTEGIVYPDGSYNPAQDVTIFDKKPDDNYTIVKTPTGNIIFSVNMDWDNKIQPMAAPASQTAPALAEIDRVLDLKKKMPSVITSRLEGGKVRTIAQIYRKLIKTSIRPGGNVNNAGDRMLEVLNRASFEFPKFASWYESRLKMAMNIFTQLDPDLVKPDNRAALLITLAVSSNGADVNTQTVDAWEVYKHWKKSGKLAGATKRGSTRAEAVEEHLALADKMSEHLGGFSNLGDFLNKTGTVKELRNELRKMHLWDKKEILGITTGELIDEIVPFSLIFGPKLGSFFNNMSGDFSTITMDRWFMRTIGRMMGTQLVRVDKGTLTKAWSRLNAALAEYDGDLFTIAGIPQKADLLTVETLGKHFQKKENRENLSPKDDAIRLAVNGLFKIADGFTLAEAPKNGTHRRWIRKVMINAIEKYNRTAKIPLVPAEAQALLWYYEKIVHQQHGSRQKDDAPDYGSAANRLYIKERGLPSSLYEDSDGIKPRSGGGRSAAFSGNQSVGTTQGSGDGTSRGDVAEMQPMAGPNSDPASIARDAEYLAAVNAGDMEKAQRMVDEAAKAAGFMTKAYHKTWETFIEFIHGGNLREERSWKGSNGNTRTLVGQSGKGFFFSLDKDNTPAYHNQKKTGEKILNVYLKYINPLVFDKDTKEWAIEVFGDGNKEFPRIITNEAYDLVKQDYDSIELHNEGYNNESKPDEVIVLDPSQIKSADPVTRDESGNVIPLSKRFNKESNNIQYMAAPSSGITNESDAEFVESAVAEWQKVQEKARLASIEKNTIWSAWNQALKDAGPWYNKEKSPERTDKLEAVDSARSAMDKNEELVMARHEPIKGVYLRFGKLPEGGRSTNGYTGHKENGISVYNVRWEGGRWTIVDDGSGGATQESIIDDANRSILLVTGDDIDQGSDEEPVLSNIRVLKELNPNEIVPANWDAESWDEHHARGWSNQYMAAPKQNNIVEPGFYSYLQNVISVQLPDTLATKPGKTVKGRPIAERTITGKDGKVLKVIRAGQEPDKVYPAQTVASQVKEIMEKAEVTSEEIKWSGIIPWLFTKESVTKEEVLDYLKTEGSTRFVERKLTERSRSFRDYMDIINDRMSLAGNYSKFEEDKKFIEERLDTWMSKGDPESIKYLQMITDLDIDEINPPGDGEIGYPQEKLRTIGGRNYREVIVTTSGQSEVTLKKGLEIKQMDSGRWNIWDSSTKGDGPGWVLAVGKETRDAVVGYARSDDMLAAENQQQFASGHYPEVPNYIAHMRIQDFNDGLLIDELQSDREKETRKKGLLEEQVAADKRRVEIENKGMSATPEEKKEWADIMSKHNGKLSGVPDAPFRRSAQWSMQLFKRALRDAVADGKEWIGWTSGEVQNKRSGLENRLSEVKMTKAFGGRDGRYYLTAYDHNFKRVIDTIIKPEELPNKIGNELAQKMNAMEWTTGKVEQANGSVTEETFKKLKGLDIKVGGKGMTDLYDKIVPTEVNEYLKQWGVKAEPSEITSTSGTTLSHRLNILNVSNFSIKNNINGTGKFGVWDFNLRRLVLDGVGEDGGNPISFDTKKDAEDWIVNGDREKIKISIWKVKITPEMRESIKDKGQPLFMAGPRHESPDAAESFLEQMMGELPSEAELEALRQMALSQKPGEKTIGDPDKANISKNEKIRVEYEVSQQIRSGDVSPEKVQDWIDQGRRMARNEDDVMNQVMSSYFEGGGFDSPELVFASAIVTARKFRRALQSGDPAQMREAHAMAYADGAGRSQTARAMRAMADPHKSPHERNMEYIAKLITTPSIRERIEIAAAPSPFAKQKQIAKLKAKLEEVKALLAESEKSRVRGKTHDDLIKQTKALSEEIKTQSEEKDRKTLIEEYTEARHKSVMDALAAQGISEEDIFVTPEERVNSHDSVPVREAMGMHPQEHQDAIRYIMRGYSHADVAVMTGLPRDVINTIHQDFRQKSLRGTIAKWVKRGNTLFDTIQSGIKYITGQSMAAPMPYNTAINNKLINAEVEIERQLNVLCPTAKQVNSGKMIVEIVDTKKNGQQVTIKVPYSPTDFRATYRVARAISISQSSAYDKMYEYWIMNLLSGPETNVVNVIGNILSSGIHILAQKPLETLWNIIFQDPNSAQMGEWKHIMRGIMPGIRDAFAMAALAFDSEADPIGHRYMDEPLEMTFDKAGQLDKVGRYRGPSIAGAKGRIFRLPGRSLMMVDSFMKALMGNIEVGAQAYRLGKQAQKAGLIGNSSADIESFIKAEVSTPGSKSWELAIDVATELAFQSETWMSAVARAFAQPNLGADQYQKKALDAAAAGNIKKMHDMRRAANAMMFIEHAMRFIFPFVRTPTNILRIGIRKSPIGAISLAAHVMTAFGKGATNIKNKKRFWANQDRATIVTLMAEQTQAWLTFATVFSMTEGDDDDDDKKLIIVGGRPSGTTSPGSRNEAYRNYGGTYMIIYRHNNGKETRVPFGRYDPIATVLGTTVDSIIEIKRMHKMRSLGLDGGSAMNATTNIIGSLMSQTEDKSFFQGYSNMVKTVDSLRRAGDAPSDLAYGFLKQIISGVVPNLLRQPLRNADPLVRDSKDKAELLYSALPLGIWAGPVVDYYGREVEKGGSPVSRIFIRAGNKATTREPAEEWITEWNNLHPDDKFQPTDLRANDYWVYGPKGERRMITDNSVKTTFEKAVGQEILRMHNNYVSGLKKSTSGKIISGKDNNVDLKNKLTNLASEAKKAVRTRFLKSPFASARNTID